MLELHVVFTCLCQEALLYAVSQICCHEHSYHNDFTKKDAHGKNPLNKRVFSVLQVNTTSRFTEEENVFASFAGKLLVADYYIEPFVIAETDNHPNLV